MNSLWKRADKLAIVVIIIMMAMQASLYKIFANIIPIFNYSYNTPFICVIYVLMIALVYILVFVPRLFMNGNVESENHIGNVEKGKNTFGKLSKNLGILWEEYDYLIVEIMVLLLAIVVTDTVTIVNGQLRISNIITHNLDYIYVLLALPMTVLLVEDKWKFEHFADAVLLVTVASMIFRIVAMLYYGKTGIELECITRESTFEGWVRNGRIRMIPPCFIMIILPLSIYMMASVKLVWKKVMYALSGCMSIFYAYYVWQSRMSVLCMAVGIAVMIMFGRTSKKINVIRWAVAGCGAALFIIVGGIGIVMALFSKDPAIARYFGENKGHYYSYDIFWAHFRQNFLTGCGLNETLSLGVFPNMTEKRLWLTDAGILYSLVPMGILIGIFLLMMFGRGVFAYISKGKIVNMAVLPFAVTATLMVCEISMDCFFTPSAFAVPFYIVIVEYVIRYKGNENEQ